MRLTEAIVQKSPQITNPLGERELDLRGAGLQQMDESVLSKIADDFDILNLCDNQIKTLDGFAKSERLTTLMLHQNSTLATVTSGVTVRTPNLHTFVANGCGFTSLSSLNFLAGWPKLERVSFLKCPFYDSVAQTLFNHSGSLPEGLKGVPAATVIRLYIIVVCSTGQFTSSASGAFTNCPLKLVDFDRVLDVERQQARQLKTELLALPALLTSLVKGGSNKDTDDAALTSSSSSGPLYAPDGTRIRKRAREATGSSVKTAATDALSSSTQPAAFSSPSTSTSHITASEEVGGAGAATGLVASSSSAADSAALLADDITEEMIEKRRQAMMARIETAETEEDFMQIELEDQELHRLSALLESRTKHKKSRAEK